MRRVTLIFPDVASLAEFILSFKISKAIVDSTEKKLIATMTDKNLDTACKFYGARIKESIAIRSF
jgi:hypothetical protein